MSYWLAPFLALLMTSGTQSGSTSNPQGATQGDPGLAFQASNAAAQSSPVVYTPVPSAAATWRLKGDMNVRPSSIHDDGVRTFLEWGADQSLPAVFAVGPTGQEEVVDGYMRGATFVIDRVHPKLVFRIDRNRAVAERKANRL